MESLKFLGASVAQYNASAGWDSQESTLEVTVVEDLREDELFAPANGFISEGAPAMFVHDQFKFGGIIQNWQRKVDVSANPVYSVTLADPRIFFDGITLIIDEYAAPVTTPNVINVYGYLEAKYGFGGSGKNDAGLTARAILSALQDMMRGEGATYNGGISFRSVPYLLNVLNIPAPPAELRIQASTLTLNEFLSEVCESLSCSYFCRLDFQSAWIIDIIFLSRATQVLKGSITNYVASTPGAMVKNSGIELVNETTTKFLFGGKKTDMYAQFYQDGYMDKRSPQQLMIDRSGNSSVNNPIWHYFGKDLNGNLVLTYSNYNVFTIDSRNVNISEMGPTYATDEVEMRAALGSQDAWQDLLSIMWPFEYIPDAEGDEEDEVYIISYNPDPFAKNDPNKPSKDSDNQQFGGTGDTVKDIKKGQKTYRHSGIKNPHFMKAIRYKIPGSITKDMWSTFESIGQFHLGRVNVDLLKADPDASDDEVSEQLLSHNQLYNLVRDFAEENYGKKFVVYIPNVKVAREPDTDILRFNMLPTDAGYLDANQWTNSLGRNLIPFTTKKVKGKTVYDVNINTLTSEDNRFYCYARYDNRGSLSFAELSPEDVVYSASDSVFVRCQVQPDWEFVDNTRKNGARAIVTLPAKVSNWTAPSKMTDFLFDRLFNHMFDDDLQRGIDTIDSMNDKDRILNYIKNVFNIESNAVAYTRRLQDMDLADLKDYAKTLLRKRVDRYNQNIATAVFSTGANSDFASEAAIPDMIAIPLESQVDFYGPWISSIGTGKTVVENNDSLVPWNFNGFDVMNSVGNAMVSEVTGNMAWSENGMIDIPGTPKFSLGDALLNGGPLISDISVSFSDGGMTTSYRMQSWTPRLTKLNRAYIDKITTLSKNAQKRDRDIRDFRNLRAKTR